MHTVSLFLEKPHLLIDVRSPSEYLQGHIPSAHNIPLFSDEERALIGTLYKQKGKDKAIYEGLRIVGPRLTSFLDQVHHLHPSTKDLRIYCARGGMRSSAMSWLFSLYGFSCHLLQGGYKHFRAWVRTMFEQPYPLVLLGGLTGSGKTALLHQLAQQGEFVLDLEEHAQHKGSSFGGLSAHKQPSCEHFENLIATTLALHIGKQRIWIEDESARIGTCSIPKGLWDQMSSAPVLWLEAPIAKRITHLIHEYGTYPKSALIEATLRLQKRLGREKTTHIIYLLEQDDLHLAAKELLTYYDTTYIYAFQKRNRRRILWDGSLNSLLFL